MRILKKLFVTAFVGTALLASAPTTYADDSEVFTNSAFVAKGVRPNVLFIIDTSGSMSTKVYAYDETVDYSSAGICTDPNKLYWTTSNSATPPDCRKGSNQWISLDKNRCFEAARGIKASGWWNGQSQMIFQGGTRSSWGDLVGGNDNKIECAGDLGLHGDLPGTTIAGGENKYPRNGTGKLDSDRWGDASAGNKLDWNGKQRISLYSANYMNWWYGGGSKVAPKTRLQIVQEVATKLIANLNGVNLGLMRYDQDAEGGMVTYPVSELTATSRTAMTTLVNSYKADGYTPLSETMYEAEQYFSGGDVVYGNGSSADFLPSPSVATSRVGNDPTGTKYQSPMEFSCQNNFVVYLTDGLPTKDNSADAAIQKLDNFGTDGGGACPAQIKDPDPTYPTAGRCLENLTRYMHNHDLRPDAEVVGQQSVTTYFVGFGDDLLGSADFLDTVATAGGGKAYTQTDAVGLAAALEEIFNQVQKASDTTIVAPAVAVNAFNRTQNLNQLFVSVFAPSENRHWPGNLKKYKFMNGDVIDANGTKAVDPATGFFYDYVRAINTPGSEKDDGLRAKDGGSAAWIDSAKRNLYTYMGSSKNLIDNSNNIVLSNAGLDLAKLDAVDSDERDDLINFMRGQDTSDFNENKNLTEERKQMGDPMHARPAIVVYGGTITAPIGTVFTPTNDGYLHAFDMDTGKEQWAFIPSEFLKLQKTLFNDPPTAGHEYALDGDVRVFKKDTDGDGIVEPGSPDFDQVIIVFGTGRGGNAYYALDVTDQGAPKFLWRVGKGDTGFDSLGKTWSTPQITKIKDGTTTKDVVIVGGGYDTNQENSTYSTDSVGNALYILDLQTGAKLWSITFTGGGGTIVSDKMTHSIPGTVAVLDTNNDRLADRMYASDTGGRIWRFDIANGTSASSTSFVTGGVLASLGGASYDVGGAKPTPAQNRRFYNTPDPVLISYRGIVPFVNISIGTGYRGHPLEKTTEDRFYSVRDYSPFGARTQASYTDAAVIKESDLVDVTDTYNAIGTAKKGWFIQLKRPSWRGEKVLAESTTVNGIVFFPTFVPLDPDPKKPCLARTGNRVFAVFALNGKAAIRWVDSSTGALGVDDRATDIKTGGIAPSLAIFADPLGSTSSSSTSSSSTSSSSSSSSSGGNCMFAMTKTKCVPFGGVNRSFWEHR